MLASIGILTGVVVIHVPMTIVMVVRKDEFVWKVPKALAGCYLIKGNVKELYREEE